MSISRGGLAWIALSVALSSGSCSSLVCGENTIEQNGKCIAMTEAPGVQCGPGTTYDTNSGRCVSDLFENGGGVCGEDTTVTVDDAGVHVCIGTGGGTGDCSKPLNCPAPTTDNALTLCGRIYDLEDTTPLDDGDPSDGEPYKDVEVRVYDPIAFVQIPGSDPLLPPVTPDSCGRFRIENAPVPATQFIAIATDDLAAGGKDDLVLTGIADTAASGEIKTNMRAFVFRRSTDAKWSTSAGLAEGQTFGTMGVYVPIFITPTTPLAPFPGTPASDVQIAVIDQGTGQRTVVPDKDFYFSDSDPLIRRTVAAAQAKTGANGTGLFIMQPSLGNNFSGLGNEPQGTCWQFNPAASPTGAAFVQERLPGAQYCQ